MRCPKCGFDNPEGMKFCGQCTTPLALVCPNCRSRRQAARLFELRATTSLARLLTKQGRREEARTMLAEIYKWFTEGLSTCPI
jgi:hypothetical protein